MVASELARGLQEVRVEAWGYRHEPARTRFLLDPVPHETVLSTPLPGTGRPAPDLAAWERFLRSGLRLEGARLEPDGRMERVPGGKTYRVTMVLGRREGARCTYEKFAIVLTREGIVRVEALGSF